MGELLTTGQMIDQLKVGEMAECEHGKWSAKWDGHNLLFNFIENGGGRNTLKVSDVTRKWRILPNYVSFEKAMKALKDGRSAILHNGNFEYKFTPVECIAETLEYYKDAGADFLEWRDLFNSKWTIEE